MTLETYETIVAWLVIGTHYTVGFSKIYLIRLMRQNRRRVPLDEAVIRNQITLAIMAIVWGTLVLVLRMVPHLYVATRGFWLTILMLTALFTLPTIYGLIRAVRRERYRNGILHE